MQNDQGERVFAWMALMITGIENFVPPCHNLPTHRYVKAKPKVDPSKAQLDYYARQNLLSASKHPWRLK